MVRSPLITNDGCPISARFWQMWDSTAVDRLLLDYQRIQRPVALQSVRSQGSRSAESHICQNRDRQSGLDAVTASLRATRPHPTWLFRKKGTSCSEKCQGLVLHSDGHIGGLCLALLVDLLLNEGDDFLRDVEHLVELVLGRGQRRLEFQHVGSRAAELRE